MQLDPERDWPAITAYVEGAMRAARHVTLATAGADGQPHVTPIGSLVLGPPTRGLFLERFPRRLAADAATNPRFALLAEDTRLWQLLRHFRGDGWFGLKCYGELGERRAATPSEIDRLAARISRHGRARVKRLLFGQAPQVRDLTVTGAEAISLAISGGAVVAR
jgi:hypothetical protein